MARANAFWPTAVVGEADSVNSVSASACHIGGPKGVSPGQKALLHGISLSKMNYLGRTGAFGDWDRVHTYDCKLFQAIFNLPLIQIEVTIVSVTAFS